MPSTLIKDSFFDDFQDVTFDVKGVRLPKIIIPHHYYAKLGIDESTDNEEFLKILCRNGIKSKGLTGKKEYMTRLKYEYEIVSEIGFSDYFILIWDVINFCHENDIPVGKGRGSAAGSLILYLIGVTGIDPIQNDLIFERFVSRTRAKSQIIDGVRYIDGDMAPDVDLDICTDRREEVINYLKNKYSGKFCKLPTISTLATRAAIKDVCKIHGGFTEDELNVLTKTIPVKYGQPLSIVDSIEASEVFAQFAEENPEIIECAKVVEDMMRQKGSHASAYLIGYYDFDQYLPCELDLNGEVVCSFDMSYAQKETIKLDLLGLHGVTLVSRIEKSLGISFDNFDPNNPEIYQLSEEGDLPYGLFQIGADANYRVFKKVKPQNWEELSAVVSLARPGSLAYVDDYIKNEYNDYWGNAKMRELLGKTHGVPIYQETTMKICSEVFGFSLDEAEVLRKIIGKKQVEKVKEWEAKIFSAAEKRQMPKELAKFFWDLLNESANYSFNKCLSPETEVETPNGNKPIRDVSIGERVKGFSVEDSRHVWVEAIDVMRSESKLFEFTFEDGRTIKCSMEHKFLTDEGMLPIKLIVEKDLEVICENLEVFKPVMGYKNYYEISNKGTIKSLPRRGRVGLRIYGGSIMKPELEKDGYHKVMLQTTTHGRKRFFVHRLVAEAFLPNVKKLSSVNHKDGNKTNNCVENLEWISVRDNNRHAFSTGLNKYNNALPVLRGAKHNMAKLADSDVIEIRRKFLSGERIKNISLSHGITYDNAWSICKRKSWKHI